MYNQHVYSDARCFTGWAVRVSETYQHVHYLLRIGTKSLTDMVLRYPVKHLVSLLHGQHRDWTIDKKTDIKVEAWRYSRHQRAKPSLIPRTRPK